MPAFPSIEKPFYAIAGAGGAAVERVRARVVTLPDSLKEGGAQVASRSIDLTAKAQTQVVGLSKHAGAITVTVRKQVEVLPGELRRHLDGLNTKASGAYDGLAARGATAVAGLRGDSVSLPDAEVADVPEALQTDLPDATDDDIPDAAAE